jgi:hypothetical protein
LRFGSLQRLQVVLRHPRRPAFGPSRFDVWRFDARGPPEVGAVASVKLLRPCGFVALCAPRARPTPCVLLFVHGSHRPGAGDCATVSLSRGVPLPAGPDPATTGPDRAVRSPAIRQRSWDFLRPSQCSLAARVPAFLRFIPTCRFALRAAALVKPADFYGRRSRI